ncbi:6927_t:CDS:10 [Funneliformis mosseae]|uniref:6927_t:CDS:1 n=1 Tax=Funneliformis mosseae TaxID=27381 RepID=A0A9N9ANU7_FUNMO|nr:6927_t:CDS:10 [Funneliformis mosseae]
MADPANDFKSLLLSTIEAREKTEQESSQPVPLEGLFNGIFDPPVKKLKKEKTCINFEGLELEQSDTITKLVREFFRASLAIGNMGEVINEIIGLLNQPSWQRVCLILSLFGALITDSPTTYGMLLGLGGDITQSSSLLLPAPSITIPTIFEYLTSITVISSPELWNGILSFMVIIIQQYPHAILEIPSSLAADIVKNILKQINLLNDNLTSIELECVEKGKEVIDTLLVGKDCGGVGCVSHYHIIEQLQEIYGPPVRGQFIKVHWTMERFINELSLRRKRLAFLMMPPDAAWPLISQYSRSHEYIDLAKLDSYRPFQCDYEQFIEEGQATSYASRFRDLFFQRAPIEEVETMIKSMKLTSVGLEPVRDALFTKVHDVIKLVQSHSNFNEYMRGTPNEELYNDILIPGDLDFWELIIELGDQLYGLVAYEYIKYEEVLLEFYHMVYPKSGENVISRRNTLPKDNTLIWLLIQLFPIEKVKSQIIAQDLSNDESLFSMLIQLYNDRQVMSKDAFYLRDLSLQCAMHHQHNALKERSNLKYRHPQLVGALAYSPMIRNLQMYFLKVYKENVTKHDLFKNLPIQEIIKIAILSQLIMVADTLYVHLVPDKLMNVDKLGFPEAKFLQGGSVSHKLLDFINIHNKNRLEQLIYKMMLYGSHEPSFNFDAKDHNITCISPYTLDVVYKIVYSAPWSLEQMIKDIFAKFKRIDKSLKTHTEGNASMVSEYSYRWQHTIMQFLCHRLLRFLKYSSKAPDLLHHIKYSVSYLDHRQTYRDVEMFAIHVMMIQTDVKFIRSIADPNRDKPIWFPESELLARYMIFTLARLIKFRGLDDISPELIQGILTSIYPDSLEWSATTLSYFPEPLRIFFSQQQEKMKGTFPSISDKDMDSALKIGNLFKLFMGALTSEDETMLQEHYSKLENQSIFLMATYTVVLVDFIIEKIENDISGPPVEVCYKMLEELIWRYQILAFEHVLFALVRGQRENNSVVLGILDYLLFESEGYSERVHYFLSLKFNHRYWVEDDHHEKLMEYLKRYPEYFQYEAYAMDGIGYTDGYETAAKKLDPPLKAINMPIYYTSSIRKSLPILDLVVGRFIEFGETAKLVKLLDEFGQLYRFHQTPLAFVRDLLCYYYSAPTIRDPIICSKLIKLLDFDEYDFVAELLQYEGNVIFELSYFEKVFHKLADNMDPQKCAPKANTKFPERHFQEIPNPVVQALHIACVEILAIPTSPHDIIKATLDIILMNGKNVAVQPMVLHAIGLLYSFLPTEEFVYKMFDEMLILIQEDPHLGEFSQPCNMTGRDTKDPSIDPLIQQLLSHSTPFSTMFPYIFNDYKSNLLNFGTNAANSFLTFIHGLLHYSNIEVVEKFFAKLILLRGLIKTDIQLLYLCALVGPLMYRFEHDPLFISFLRNFAQMLNEVTINMKIEDYGDSTLALEQVYDFLHYVKPIILNYALSEVFMAKLHVQTRLIGYRV